MRHPFLPTDEDGSYGFDNIARRPQAVAAGSPERYLRTAAQSRAARPARHGRRLRGGELYRVPTELDQDVRLEGHADRHTRGGLQVDYFGLLADGEYDLKACGFGRGYRQLRRAALQ